MSLAEEVGKLYLKGKNAIQISRELEVSRASALTAIEDFKSILRSQAETALEIREKMFDILFESDESFRLVVDEAWNTVQQADINSQYGTKVQALKLVESATKNRAELVHKAGIGQDQDIIDQINDTEEKQKILIDLLRDIRNDFPEVAQVIATRLSRIQNEVEFISIEEPRDGDI